MTKKNFFGETILTPEDDPIYEFCETHGLPADENPRARFIEEDPSLGWGCELYDDALNEMQVQGFSDEESLKGWLRIHGIEWDD